jgi:hypothetical protein
VAAGNSFRKLQAQSASAMNQAVALMLTTNGTRSAKLHLGTQCCSVSVSCLWFRFSGAMSTRLPVGVRGVKKSCSRFDAGSALRRAEPETAVGHRVPDWPIGGLRPSRPLLGGGHC